METGCWNLYVHKVAHETITLKENSRKSENPNFNESLCVKHDGSERAYTALQLLFERKITLRGRNVNFKVFV